MKKDETRIFTLTVLITMLMAACGSPQTTSSPGPDSSPVAMKATETSTPQPTPMPTDTSTPQPSPTSTPPIILYQDDFSDTNSSWERAGEQGGGMLDYDQGGYRMKIPVINQYWVEAPLAEDMKANLADVAIEVDTTKLAGPDANPYGVMCRLDKNNSYYYFLITGDGFYSIGRFVWPAKTLIGMEAQVYSEVINKGDGAKNHLRAVCAGETLSLSVNGRLLIEVQDSELGFGNVGLVVAALIEAGTDILFDNFILMEP